MEVFRDNGQKGSRFRNEFRVEKGLGKDCFGNIYEVVNRLDRMKYIVKECGRKIR